MTSIDNKKISLAYRHENSVSSTNKCMRQNSSYRHAVSWYPSFSVVLIQLLQFLDRWILSFGPQTMRLCTTILASTIVPRQLLLHCSRSLFQTRLYRFHPCNRTTVHPWTYALFSVSVPDSTLPIPSLQSYCRPSLDICVVLLHGSDGSFRQNVE